ncbi:MAG: glycosyltransferase [Bacteroidia bacterium]|nr:glycosyltransferase [Bacteroidia bacterium]
MTHCTILILTYKGKHHLEYLLPTVKIAIDNTQQYNFNVLIIDNGQHIPTREWVNQNFSDYGYEFSPVNDYLFSLNAYIAKLMSEFVFVLNDDMKFNPNVLSLLMPVIENDSNLFGVMCQIMDWDGNYEASGVRVLSYSFGWAKNEWVKFTDKKLRYTLYGGGGATLYRTSMLNELKGFDTLYRPAYAEDLDLGHRAWHKGWATLYYPNAILYHREGGTIKDQFKTNRLTQNIFKNRILWMARNANKRFFLIQFIILLPWRIITGWKVDRNSYLALLKALPRIPVAVFKRFIDSSTTNDVEIMDYLGKEYIKSQLTSRL